MTTQTDKRIAPYGSWKSPITADVILASSVGLSQAVLDGNDLYWLEGRPTEAGRVVIVRSRDGGAPEDINAAPLNARTRVHEYGGGSYAAHDGTVYFSNFDDNRLYRQADGSSAQPITSDVKLRYADLVVDPARKRLICVREDHRNPDREAVNTLVSVPPDGGEEQVLASGSDFYSNPRLSPDGASLAWLSWNHPNMPWDGSDLWIAEIAADGTLGQPSHVAGGKSESIFQPEWSPDGVLHFVSDRTGWWNLYRESNGEIEALAPMEAEFGLPQWVFGMSTYGFASRTQIVGSYSRAGHDFLYSLETGRGEQAVGRGERLPRYTDTNLRVFSLPYTVLDGIRVGAGRAVFFAGSPTEGMSLVDLALATGQHRVIRRSSEAPVDSGYLSAAQEIEFPTENGLTAHGLYYAPKNADYAAAEGERPPLLVLSHGGPTGHTTSELDLSYQYWTSRGFAILDVNYGGSTGYGRAYRERLNGAWGVVDVDDCINGAIYLAERGLADADRLIIRGGSAGGYTTLAALTFRDAFAAGASHFGLADLEPFVQDTHKFESRYLEGLIGSYPAQRDLYRQRSPINSTDQLSSPMILFQGLDDKVVPPNQAEIMVEGLKRKGLPYAYIAYEGEGHGFRRAENIKRTLDAELYFYSRVFGFELPEVVEPVQIENLPAD